MNARKTVLIPVLIGMAVLMALAGCARSATASAAFTVENSGFRGPQSVPTGWTEFTLTNNSDGVHHIQLVKLLDGRTQDDLVAALTAAPEHFPDWAVPYGGPNAPDPGNTTNATVRLDAGQYAIISVIPGPDGLPGFLNGIITTLTVTEGQNGAAEPAPDAEMTLADFSITTTDTLRAGEQVLRFTNAGTQVHEAYIVRLNDGVTAEDYLNTPPDQIPPATGVGGITGIAPGESQYIHVNLEPGNYAIFCFFPDPETSAPHFVLGMVLEFTIKAIQ